MKFTKEEISLCRKIAKKHRKETREGDWIVHVNSDDPNLVRDKESIPYLNNEFQLPLWTISDCLEFLGTLKSFRAYFLETYGNRTRLLCVNYWDEQDKVIMKKGKTPLEACLKAVLAVIEEN